MKRILFLLSILSLVAVGCNRDEQQPAGGGTGMQEEQQLPSDTQSLPEDSQNMETSPDANVEEVEPSMQEMEDTEIESDPALEQDPTMQDPGMQEEEFRNQDVDTMDTTDERDSSMGSGTESAPVSEPTDATGVQQ